MIINSELISWDYQFKNNVFVDILINHNLIIFKRICMHYNEHLWLIVVNKYLVCS